MKKHTQFAVIELGSSAIRLAIAVSTGRQGFDIIENLQQTVLLGRDSFTKDYISEQTTKECIKAIKSFFQSIDEYRIPHKNIRLVATSAVREANNREQFIDRIYISTGLLIEVLDEADVCRYSYLAVRNGLKNEPFFKKENTMVIEIGGGSTDCVYFEKGKVTNSHLYKTGSLRLNTKAQKMGAYGTKEYHDSIVSIAAPTINKIRLTTDIAKRNNILALGSEIRFITQMLCEYPAGDSIVKISVKEFNKQVGLISQNSVDQLAKKYSLSYESAESLLPTLIVYQEIVNAFKVKHLYVQGVSLRTGIMQELMSPNSWTNEYKKQVYNSAVVLAKKYTVRPRYISTVSKYSSDMLAFLSKFYEFHEEDEVILHVASLLHEIGHFISPSNHNQHALYIIKNSDLFGISTKNRNLIAMVACYHRGASPKNTHKDYMLLNRTDKIRVTKLAAILRITRIMSMHTQTYKKHSYKLKEDVLQIHFDKPQNTQSLNTQVKSPSKLFSSIYGLKIIFN